MKPCIPVADIMKMSMWIFNGPRINFERITAFELSRLGNFVQCTVWSLCDQIITQFSMDVSQTLQTYCGHITNVHVGFGLS